MDRPPIDFGFSTCPNDTFAFHALVHGLVPGPPVAPFMADIEVLNQRAERGEAAVTKVSTAWPASRARSSARHESLPALQLIAAFIDCPFRRT